MVQYNHQAQTHLRALERTADEIRLQGWNSPRLRRMPKWLNAMGRVLTRVFTLGRILEGQAQLTHGLIDHHLELDGRVEVINNRLAQLEQQVTDQLLREVKQQAEHQSKVDVHLAQNATHLSEIGTHLKQTSEQVLQISAQVEHEQAERETQLAHILAQLNALDGRVSGELAEQLRLNTSYLRLTRQQMGLGFQLADSQSDLIVTGDELLELLQILDDTPFALSGCSAIELSIQAEHVEELITAGASYLGDRLSSKGPIYRSPNDAWIHIDFTPEGNRLNLFESAAMRLKPNGKFVLVTLPDRTSPLAEPRLAIVDNRVIRLNTSRTVRIYMWEAKQDS